MRRNKNFEPRKRFYACQQPKHCFSVGEGLNTNEYFKIYLAIRKLITDYPVDGVRFWGKIFGTQHDYYIIECQPSDYDAFQHSEENVQERVEEGSKRVPQLSNSTWKPPLDVPAEEIGEGVNNRVYFASNYASGPYTLLPLCHPKHITVARMIYSYFTGDLISKVSCWPPFPGTEAQYLRAQIARISSGIILAPKNFFRILQEEEQNAELSDEEGEIVPTECEENEEYVPQAVEAMRSSDWVHSRPYILPQGRVNWINMRNIEESELDDRESGGTETATQLKGPENEPEKREKGPQILTPISNDIEIDGYEPWRFKKTRDGSYLLISSFLWPGAHTAARDGSFENIYVGWGLKATKPHEFPGWLSHVQSEILHEPKELVDPTPEQEKANEAIENEEESDGNDEDDEKVGEEEVVVNEGEEISNASSNSSQN
nr:radial spoke head protein 4 A [Hymenolepis microstoma]